MLERYLVTVSQPSRSGQEVTDNITVLSSSPRNARELAKQAFRTRHGLSPAITLWAETPVICPNNVQAASWQEA